MLVEISANDAGDTTDIHNAGDTKVKIAALLCNDLAGCSEKKRGTLNYSCGDKRHNLCKNIHYSAFSFLFFLRKWI